MFNESNHIGSFLVFMTYLFLTKAVQKEIVNKVLFLKDDSQNCINCRPQTFGCTLSSINSVSFLASKNLRRRVKVLTVGSE